MMLGADSHWKDIRSEDGEMNMCKALEDLRQEGIDAEQRMKRCWKREE